MALVAALTLVGCAGEDQATFDEETPAGAGSEQDDGAEESGDGGAQETSEPPADASERLALTPVEWADAPRELTAVEREFMYEPGPFAGDRYDRQRVIEAVLAMSPRTVEEWQHAIQSQIQGDYADDLKAAITFDASLDDASEGPAEGTGPAATPVGTNHFALVLDASGSMARESGSSTRMAEAKEALSGFVDALPHGATVSLRVYGHEGDNTDAGKDVSCASSELVHSGPVEAGEFSEAVGAVDPTGWTPLALGIAEAAGDFPADATDGIVYVVTDGLETCGGDPVAAAEELSDSGIEPIINVIGFQTEDADQEALRSIARAGGGEYTHVGSQAELERYWEEEYSRMMTAWDEWMAIELTRIDQEGQERMSTADDLGQRLMAGADDEGQRGMELADALHTDGHFDFATNQAVWSYFHQRSTDMWNYALDLSNANWSEALDTTNRAWTEVYEQGNTKWSEYYARSLGD